MRGGGGLTLAHLAGFLVAMVASLLTLYAILLVFAAPVF
jgi:hypothetical protein